MNDIQQLTRRVQTYLFLTSLFLLVVAGVTIWAILTLVQLGQPATYISVGLLILLLSYIFSHRAAKYTLEPFTFLWQAIMHVSPNSYVNPPNLDKLRVGRELVTKLSYQVYQFASQQNSSDTNEHTNSIIQSSAIVSHLPLPLFVFNKELLVTHASEAGLEYCEVESAVLFGKPIFDHLNLEFSTERTLDTWIKECQNNKVTDNSYWERVRVRLPDGKTLRMCDIAAEYNRDNPSGAEFIVTLFDHTERYKQDEESLGFVALAVHELRTPLTMLRGYIEVFEDELSDKLDNELKNFMYKMQVSAQQLSTFVSNILNVARIEDNQLTLQLKEEKWDEVLRNACSDLELKAQVHGKTVEYAIAPDLPTVAVDRISIYEVISNLIDNAIKYSGASKRIIVSSRMGDDGNVETTIQDFGVGIPSSVLPNLFEKFYRNHRTRAQIGGTGLGLYLSKAIVSAHGGRVWAQSKEGEGSTFGFALIPFGKIDDALKSGNDITKHAHGWIKNHSLYKR